MSVTADNVIAFAPHHRRLRAERAKQAVLRALARHADGLGDGPKDGHIPLALAVHELVADPRAGRDLVLALAAFRRKTGDA